MSMAEESIRKATITFNASVDCWGCTNYLKYHADRFQTYRNFPNKRDTDIAERAKQSIQEYDQINSMKVGSRGDQDIQGYCCQKYAMELHSMFAEQMVQLTQSWKQEGSGYIYDILLMCEMMDWSSSRLV